ncbi:YqiJ family protein [Agrobacterium tumefaciens]|uniref:OB-fold-containig protein n=1 Tax=Agrobacterium tumefaciens TaxID=358 RepID=UPI001572F071|nr:OB-fold-containig protein [Agrobacterium tumefaciens]NTE58981.1 YqiJ family protein [Agrobacterium tumefaciens]NTE72579.1 YqiJ family protein [Agrobacterium tumefaciens]
MEGIVQPGTAPFWIALLTVAGLGIVELVSVLLGVSASGLLDDSFSYHAPGDTEAGLLGSWMSWLNAGGVPLLVLTVILLSVFAVTGFFIQGVASTVLLGPLPLPLAVTGAVAAAIPATRSLSLAVAKVIPRDETNALEQADFLGLTGVVTIGPLDQGKPGTVRVKDRHDNIHFLRAQAASGHTIDTGAQVLIVDGADGLFQAIPAPPDLKNS